jgi:hypothetical protein
VQRHGVGGRLHPVIIGGSQVVQHGRGDDAARAEPNDVDVRAAGDLARHLDRRQDPPRMDLEIPASLLGAGVSPAQH